MKKSKKVLALNKLVISKITGTTASIMGGNGTRVAPFCSASDDEGNPCKTHPAQCENGRTGQIC